MWVQAPDCEDVVRDAWSSSMALGSEEDVATKIKRCGVALQRWSAKEFGNVTKRISDARKKLVVIDAGPPSEANVLERKEVCGEIDKLLGLEETMWRQRSRVDNLK